MSRYGRYGGGNPPCVLLCRYRSSSCPKQRCMWGTWGWGRGKVSWSGPLGTTAPSGPSGSPGTLQASPLWSLKTLETLTMLFEGWFVGVGSGSNSPPGHLVALGMTDLRHVDHLTPTISVMNVERKVTMPTTVTATAAGAGGAGPGLAPGPMGGVTLAAGAEGGGPGLSVLVAPTQSLPEDPDLPHLGGPGPDQGPGAGPSPGPGRVLEAGAGLDPWVSLALDLQLELARPQGVLLQTDDQLNVFLFFCL
ncbi:uncharacterized protein LOC130166057 isoform X3 [Seriola aureovittata]|uniref:uncharacterized protein LOC130166057 isoform X3 n=1 Tax=Seriola aureovittata TaxID=2871759 RepID=UPI0024BF0704|nr:uncharacterized protein LOC130166057 isoform X3 [Seriola aureovittata]